MSRPRHIAVAIDFSEHSRTAARLAYGLASGWGADVTLIHAAEPIGSHYPAAATLLPELLADQIEQSRRQRALSRLDALRDELEASGPADRRPTVWVSPVYGRVGDAICLAALEAAAELLVIGSRGKSQVGSWLLGSVVRDVSASAHCPVLVVRAHHDETRLDGFAQITIGVDHTDLTLPSIAAARGVLSERGQLALVKSWDLPTFGSEDSAEAGFKTSIAALNVEAMAWETSRLETLCERAGLKKEDTSLRVEIGKPASELLSHATRSKADLIVVGAHSRDSVVDRVLGTTAERVLRHSSIPVLVYPASALTKVRTCVSGEMIEFRELNGSDCKSYLIVGTSDEAMVVDPLLENVEEVAALIAAEGLSLRFVVDTCNHDDHDDHNDHVSGARRLVELAGGTYVVHENSKASGAGLRVSDGDVLALGALKARVLFTPGHAADAISLAFPDRLLTGDFLLVGAAGAGRTDLPGGDPGEHWDALRELRRLPATTLVFPGHDDHGQTFSTLAEERINNPRLSARTRRDYIEWIEGLDGQHDLSLGAEL